MRPSKTRRSIRPVFLAVAIAAAGCTHRYAGRGVVLRVEPEARRVTVSHDAISGYMDAMVMPFEIGGRAPLPAIAAGDRITFRLNVRRRRSWLDALAIVSAPRSDVGLQTSPTRPVLVPVGGRIPDFTLRDHRGRDVSRSTFAGQTVVVTFIYTRCPLPDYCPRMMGNLRAVAAQFRGRLGRDLTLVTVTFDPRFDTPDVLAAYARAHRADGPGWVFLTGDEAAVARVCDAFGVERWPEEGLLTHTLQTAVVDREGRLAGTIEGRDYTSRQLIDLVAATLDR
jgi:protein SCO1/2